MGQQDSLLQQCRQSRASGRLDGSRLLRCQRTLSKLFSVRRSFSGQDLFGCALLCLGLAGCGSPAQVAASPQPATAPQRSAAQPNVEAPTVKDAPYTPAPAPALSLAAFHEKVFALIGGIQNPEDVSRVRVEELTRIPLGPTEVDGMWLARGVLDSGAVYSFSFKQFARDDKRVSVSLPDEKFYDPERRRPCVLALADLHDMLKAQGYQEGELPGPHGRPQAWQYWKDRQSVIADYTHQATTEGGSIACVFGVTIEMIIED